MGQLFQYYPWCQVRTRRVQSTLPNPARSIRVPYLLKGVDIPIQPVELCTFSTHIFIRPYFVLVFSNNLQKNTDWQKCWHLVGNRYDSLATRWPHKMSKVKGGSCRRVLTERSLGNRKVDVMGVLGEGAFAVVFSCRSDEDRHGVAVKIELQVRPHCSPSGRSLSFWHASVPRLAGGINWYRSVAQTTVGPYSNSRIPALFFAFQGRGAIIAMGVLHHASTTR